MYCRVEFEGIAKRSIRKLILCLSKLGCSEEVSFIEAKQGILDIHHCVAAKGLESSCCCSTKGDILVAIYALFKKRKTVWLIKVFTL